MPGPVGADEAVVDEDVSGALRIRRVLEGDAAHLVDDAVLHADVFGDPPLVERDRASGVDAGHVLA